jgi:hypothetical protein
LATHARAWFSELAIIADLAVDYAAIGVCLMAGVSPRGR